MYLTSTTTPEDVKALDASQLPELCREVRQVIIDESATNGGHIAPNLAVVELTVALHYVFSSPTDQIIFDVSHQSYAHKLLTGRAQAFLDPAHYGEVSGFANPDESEHDLFAMGHTSTSVSLACGLAKARDLAGKTHDVIAVIGDGSLSGGLAFEGLSNAAELGSGLIVIVNDNEQSIAENHGGLYGNLAELRATHGAAENNFFRALGLDYRYLEGGNDVLALTDALEDLRGCTRPTVLHIHTAKGLGLSFAEADPESWHHVGPFDIATGERRAKRGHAHVGPDYAKITGELLLRRMKADRSVVGISAATPYIMGFTPDMRAAAGDQFVDPGIAEEHAVTFAAALAKAGAKPVFGVYGTFLQRAYDELWHDLCLNDAPATLLVFGCSAAANTDQTHLSYFDISMLGGLPNLRYLAPVCVEEYKSMLEWAIDHREHPVAIRVPAAGAIERPDLAPAADEDWGTCSYRTVRTGSEVAVLALGSAFELGEQTVDTLAAGHGIEATLINPRFASELDAAALDALAAEHRAVITIEDGILEGGWGEKVAARLAPTAIRCRAFGIAKGFPDRVPAAELFARNGMAPTNMAAAAMELIG